MSANASDDDDDSEWMQVALQSSRGGDVTLSAVTEPASGSTGNSSVNDDRSGGPDAIARMILGTVLDDTSSSSGHRIRGADRRRPASWSERMLSTVTVAKRVGRGIRCVSSMRRNPVTVCVTDACTRAIAGHLLGSLVHSCTPQTLSAPWLLSSVQGSAPYILVGAVGAVGAVGVLGMVGVVGTIVALIGGLPSASTDATSSQDAAATITVTSVAG